MDGLTVSKLADQVGTSADALRYYERIGLLPEPERSAAGYRLYGNEAIERVRFIKRAQRFGLRLDDIGGLIEVRERGMCPCGGTRRLLETRLAQLDDEMASLGSLRADIRAMLDEPAGDPAAEQSGCGPLCGTGLLQIQRHRPVSTTA
ncbi:MAG TPA: MerR family transcriptional regulator [Acidimicrobiales bacterium]|jgi:DNA-binding transcriptional MerR regulator|nr:MerR family transcriptional regulator [Acidimicrobiales bacterium]